MVGRSGRSKGCFSCRRRKKGCDLARPQCGQCVKSKIACKGYDDTLGIIVYDPSGSRSDASLQSTAVEARYIDTFWEMLLPTTHRASRNPNWDWTSIIWNRYTSDGPFNNVMLALTLSRIGQQSGNNSVARSGAVRYNDCLREVARKIDLQKGACNDETLAVCLMLSLYEIMCSPTSQGTNWKSHIRGLGILMQLRGPQSFTSGASHSLFTSARMDIIFASLVFREATFLDSYEWTTVPWSSGSTPKSLYDKVIDLCAQVPRVMELLDRIRIATPQQTSDQESLLSACWRLDDELQSWYNEFVTTCQMSHCTDSFVSSVRVPDLDEPLTEETKIEHEHAQALSVYWTTCCFLYVTIRLVWQACDNPLYLLPPRIDPLRYATLISRSLPYFSMPGAGEGSLVNYAMGIGGALHCFSVNGQLCSPDAKRLTKIFLENPRGIGHHVGMFLKTLAVASIDCRLEAEALEDDDIDSLGKKWWGGGRDKIVLRPRTPVVEAATV